MYKSKNPKNLKTLLIRCIENSMIENSYLNSDLDVECFRKYFVITLMKLIDDYVKDKNDLTNDRLLKEYISWKLFLRGMNS
jgi:hypothetical protein